MSALLPRRPAYGTAAKCPSPAELKKAAFDAVQGSSAICVRACEPSSGEPLMWASIVPKRDYLSFERTPRPEEVQENPPGQIEKLEHPAFIARFGRSDQTDWICDRDNHRYIRI